MGAIPTSEAGFPGPGRCPAFGLLAPECGLSARAGAKIGRLRSRPQAGARWAGMAPPWLIPPRPLMQLFATSEEIRYHCLRQGRSDDVRDHFPRDAHWMEEILCPLLPGRRLKAYSQMSSGFLLYSELISGR